MWVHRAVRAAIPWGGRTWLRHRFPRLYQLYRGTRARGSIGLSSAGSWASTVRSLSVEHNRDALADLARAGRGGDRDGFRQRLWTNREVLRHYLQSFTLDNAGRDYVVPYVDDALVRFIHTLALVPVEPGLRVLELGGNPYLLSVLLHRFLDHRIEHANFFGSQIYDATVGRGTQTIESREYGEKHTFEFDLFNLELSEYPYAAETFDLVVFCEILEHLVIDPLRVFARLRRILRPGGRLLITTPNAVRLVNFALIVAGSNFFDRYHPEFGVYGRHNREFTVEELVEILRREDFEIETATTLDRYDYSDPILWKDNYEKPARLPYTARRLESMLRRIGGTLEHRGDNIYVLARRSPSR